MGYRSYIIFATEKISERPMNNTSAMTIVNKKSNLKEATYSMVMGAENLSSRNAGAQDNNCLVVPMYAEQVHVEERKTLTEMLAKHFNLVDNEEYREDMTIEEKINYNNHVLFQTALVHSVVRKMATIAISVFAVAVAITAMVVLL